MRPLKSHPMRRPDTSAPRTHRAPFWLGLAVLVLSIACRPAFAEQGQDTSGLFTVDTRWGFSEGAGVSRLLTVDTRLSGSSGGGASGLFTVDTTGTAARNARLGGRVTDALGTGLGGATVTALQSSVVRAHVGTDAGGYYQLNALPAGTYELRATKPDYLTRPRPGMLLAAGQTVQADFALEPKPAVAQTEKVVRAAERIESRQVTGEQLKMFEGGQWVVGGWFDPTRPTVVMTHGWNSDPGVWASGMAQAMIQGGARANLLCWDWKTAAGPGLQLSLAWSATPYQGEALGRKLAETFTPSYRQGVHFIGHSLGTLVNSRAADTLHRSPGSEFEWLRQNTHMTLLDDAEVANLEGQLVALVRPTATESISAIPEYARWIDNYISLVGGYHPEAVNVWLVKAPDYGDTRDPVVFGQSLHAYAARWYSRTAEVPGRTILGNRYSYEQHGSQTTFADPVQYPRPSLFAQDVGRPGQDDLVRLWTQEQIKEAANYGGVRAAGGTLVSVARYGVNSTVRAAEWAVQKAGSVALDVVEWIIPPGPGADGTPVFSGIAGSTPAYYRDSAVQPEPDWSLQLKLGAPRRLAQRAMASATAGSQPRLHGIEDPDSDAPRAWVPLAIPTNAALFSFDFALTGDPGEDLLSASIGGTNVFLIEGRFMPAGTLLNSGPIDVSQWAGRTVEFFFGLLGETASDATVTVGGMRFYEIEAPQLTVELLEGSCVLSWPLAAEGYRVESATTLAEPTPWVPAVEAPTIAGMRLVLTNAVAGEARFYRLRR